MTHSCDSISPAIASRPLSALPPQFAAKVRRVIYLHMAGAPSQLELFEHKPDLKRLDGQDCPASFLAGKRFAFISGVPKLLGLAVSISPSRTKRSMDFRSPAASGESTSTTSASSSPCARTSSITRRRSLLVHTGNARLGYPSLRFLGTLRTRHGESESAGIYRAAFGRQIA